MRVYFLLLLLLALVAGAVLYSLSGWDGETPLAELISDKMEQANRVYTDLRWRDLPGTRLSTETDLRLIETAVKSFIERIPADDPARRIVSVFGTEHRREMAGTTIIGWTYQQDWRYRREQLPPTYIKIHGPVPIDPLHVRLRVKRCEGQPTAWGSCERFTGIDSITCARYFSRWSCDAAEQQGS